MAGMPEMQEHFPASAMDGGYAGNAGAFSGARMDGGYAGNAGAFSGARMDGGYAGNAGAFSGARMDGGDAECRSNFRRCLDGTSAEIERSFFGPDGTNTKKSKPHLCV